MLGYSPDLSVETIASGTDPNHGGVCTGVRRWHAQRKHFSACCHYPTFRTQTCQQGAGCFAGAYFNSKHWRKMDAVGNLRKQRHITRPDSKPNFGTE